MASTHLEQTLRLLRRVDVLRHLSDEDLAQLVPYVQRRRIPAGTVVFVQDDPGRAVYFVLEGRIKIIKTTPDGDEQILYICEPGDVFGAVILFDSGHYPATAEAAVDCHLAYLLRDDYQTLGNLLPELESALLKELGTRLRRAHQRLLSFTAHNTEGRLAELLLQLTDTPATPSSPAGPTGETLPLRLKKPPTHQEMANYIGAARETVSRTLARWRQSGWISSDAGQLLIHDPDALRRQA
ncbi:MAG: Crp/Fnr family transcriptional regulator [Thermaerobacterales bacterium]